MNQVDSVGDLIPGIVKQAIATVLQCYTFTNLISCSAKHMTLGELGNGLLSKKPTRVLSWSSGCKLKLP